MGLVFNRVPVRGFKDAGCDDPNDGAAKDIALIGKLFPVNCH
jgi:hypothetical protein